MTDRRHQAYLDAMGIDVWQLRKIKATESGEPQTAPLIKLGSVGGGVLLLCAAAEDSSSRLANDIGRSLGGVPVWAWPHQDEDSVELVKAVDEHLFTTVAIFGQELASDFFADGLPANLNSANLVLLPSIKNIQSHADTRRSLWKTLCSKGMVSAN